MINQCEDQSASSMVNGGTRTSSIRWLYRPSKWHYDGFTGLLNGIMMAYWPSKWHYDGFTSHANTGVPGHFSIWWINIFAMICSP